MTRHERTEEEVDLGVLLTLGHSGIKAISRDDTMETEHTEDEAPRL